jgi:uncharacterized protein
VSGINSSLARKIVKYREEKGRISSREELCSVPGMGPKSYEQCAGFLKIPESPENLDNTWVHPENYEIARNIKNTITVTGNLNAAELSALREKYGVGDTTINDIVEELKKPNRDPRDGYPKPVMQKGVVKFEDLSEGMMITGKIKNVVDFGAFVDLGIKETALVHISEMSDRYVKDPLEAVKVGDILEFRIISLDPERRRISLSRKSGEAADRVGKADGKADGGAAPKAGAARDAASGGKKRVVAVKAGGGEKAKSGADGHGHNAGRIHGGERGSTAGPDRDHAAGERTRTGTGEHNVGGGIRGGRIRGGETGRPAKDDDGTMYNPFAEALRKMKEKGGKK